MDAAPHHEGGRPGGLQEDLGDEQRGDGTWGEGEAGLFSLRAERGRQRSLPELLLCAGCPGPVAQQGSDSRQDSWPCGEAV